MHKLAIKLGSFPKISLKSRNMHDSNPFLVAIVASAVKSAMNCFRGFGCNIPANLSSFHC